MEEKKAEVGYGKLALVNHADSVAAGAVLEIEKGKKTDMIFHRLGHKLVYVLAGKLKVSVLRDGILNAIGVNAGASFYIKPGLIYQFEAIEKAIVVEFAENINVYNEDIYCIAKAPIVKAKPDDIMKMTQEDVTQNANVQEVKKGPVVEETKSIRKKKPAKKKSKELN
jgi:quercetin dioxygenase-like cupin family protein